MSVSPRVLLLPGWFNSGPGHWQTLWEERHGYQRVQEHDWDRPLRGDWIMQLEEAVLADAAPAVLVAHSLGSMQVAAWAAHSTHTHRVRAAMLVAPGDVERQEIRAQLHSWSPIALAPLPFRSLLLASDNDPYCTPERARHFAACWGSQRVDCGACGHINAESGLGEWPKGHAWLQSLLND